MKRKVDRSVIAKKGWRTRRDKAAKTTWALYKPKPEHSPEIMEEKFRPAASPFAPETHVFGDIQLTLNARQNTHGDFTDNARVMQQMKNVARTGNNWMGEEGHMYHLGNLTYAQREAIDQILLKVGRIVTGNPNEADHWADIEGYARLARERVAK